MAVQIATDRLVLRNAQPSDAEALAARRSDPEVARLQGWRTPFTLEQADALLAEVSPLDGGVDDRWGMLTVLDTAGEVLGDVAVSTTWEGRMARVGYTFASQHWGHGYAAEAVAGVVRWLFEERDVERVEAGLDPANHASAMVLERVGFEYEGCKVHAYWTEDGRVCDDAWYGLTRDMWRSWLARPTTPPSAVRLVPVDETNYRVVRALRTHKSQERFVSPVIRSFSDAQFPEPHEGHPVVPWMRAVQADDDIVGFVMVALSNEHHANPYLWRLLIDRHHQRRGVGRRVLDLVVEECRRRGDTSIEVSWVDGKGSPRPLYERYGFVPTGDIEDGEILARLVFG